MKFFSTRKNNTEIIKKNYRKILDREPDDLGFNHYLSLMERKEIDEKRLVEILKNSDEYKRKKMLEFHSMKKPYVFKSPDGISYHITPNSVLDNIVVREGTCCKWITSKLNQYIKNDGIIFDVGANVGLLSLPFAKQYVSRGLVYAFEPDPELIKQLKENIRINKLENIIIVPLALQDNQSIETITLYKRRAIHDDGLINKGLSTIQQNPTYNVSKEEVLTSTIDRYVDENKIKNVSLIKIDVEGAEFRVLSGGSKTIDMFKPIIIYEYANIIDKLIDFPNTQKCFQLLKDKGYKQYQILNNETLSILNEYDTNLPESDIVCFPESYVL